MTTDFEQRAEEALRLETGLRDPSMRFLSLRIQGELEGHQHWVRSHGRFGFGPLVWEGECAAFTGRICNSQNFERVTLVDCTLRWSDFRCASFADAVLKNVKFERCDLEECDFSRAQLQNVTFDNCFDVDKAKFEGSVFLPPESIDAHPPKRQARKNRLRLG